MVDFYIWNMDIAPCKLFIFEQSFFAHMLMMMTMKIGLIHYSYLDLWQPESNHLVSKWTQDAQEWFWCWDHNELDISGPWQKSLIKSLLGHRNSTILIQAIVQCYWCGLLLSGKWKAIKLSNNMKMLYSFDGLTPDLLQFRTANPT